MNDDAYHLAQNGQNTGPFILEQVRAMWRSGTLYSQTLYWKPGQADWQPLGQIAATLGAPAPVPVEGTDYLTRTVWVGPPETSGMAIASFVLGLTSLPFSILTGIPAIICGHVALSQIDRSAGRLTGRGFAITGLVIGYLYLALMAIVMVLFMVGIGAGVLLPALNETSELGRITRETARARQIATAIKSYEGDHHEQTPPDLDALFPTYLSDHSLLTHRSANGEQEVAFDYLLPDTKVEGMDGHTALLRSHEPTAKGKRVYVYLDDNVEVKTER